MTQSGQGEEPSARPAREGVVLPSDGGAPLVPGGPAAAPPGGQAWGTPWGPEAGQNDQAAGGQWPTPPDQQQWGAPEQSGWSGAPAPGPAPSAGPLPPETPPGAQPPYGTQGGYGGQQAYGAPNPHGGDAHGSYGAPQGAQGAHGGGHGGAQGGYGGAPLPPAVDEATRYIPPVAAAPAPGANADATQYLPPVAPGAPAAEDGATQYLRPVNPGALPPETPGGTYGGPGAAPQAPYGGPSAQHGAGAYGAPGAEAPAETTTYLGRAQQTGPAAGGSDADATQYIPPVSGTGGERQQPPAEFAGLFRSEPGEQGGATQQMPRMQAPQGGYAPQPSYDHGGPGGPGHGGAYPGDGGRRGGDGGRGGRTGSRVAVIAAVGIGIAVLGIGAGALMGSGDDGDDSKNVSASTPATAQSTDSSPSASPSEDPAKAQAVELDKLLADSGTSRQSVINAVGNVKSCDNLGQAAKDLRAAAEQRNGLVTRLEALSVDQLPANGELTTALTNAWKASAAADSHYAAWADQVAGNRKKFCKGGQARVTGQAQEGNTASGTATAEKNKAAGLWNAIARKYGLTERQPTQL
ncbi:hypothetical protein [Streptomyces sp. NPDC053367]|uniref:hypothetical protein n=1 Tax=Streptomyces sp. NPDC053367 TaxID=3365700 RepID=UPI0037D6BBDC